VIFRNGTKGGGQLGKGGQLPPRISSRPPDILTPIFTIFCFQRPMLSSKTFDILLFLNLNYEVQ